MVGLRSKLSQLNDQGPSRKCDRCGLSYFLKKYSHCPHCTDLSESELRALVSKVERESAGNAALGRKMIIISAIVIVITVILIRIL